MGIEWVTWAEPVRTFQMMAELSIDAVTIRVPSGDQATSVISPPCPLKKRTTGAFHSRFAKALQNKAWRFNGGQLT